MIFAGFAGGGAPHNVEAGERKDDFMIQNKKPWRRAAVFLWLLGWVLSAPALAAEELIPVGAVVGIQMNTEGVLVAETPTVETEAGPVCPAGDAGIRAGDLILALDGRSTRTAAELGEMLSELGEEPVRLTVERDGRRLQFDVTPARQTDGSRRLGLWLRDGIAGVGTVTYYDPDTGAYGALGHGVNDVQTGVLLPLGSGSVCAARVVDVKMGAVGTPGALAGVFDMTRPLGSIEINCPCGIFGIMDRPMSGLGPALPVAGEEEIENGPAVILSTVSGDGVQEFDVHISRTAAGDESRALNIRVTDPELLQLTGGIVQGMSGSPIIQDGKLVGAVTHVLVNDPTRGYGIPIGDMLAAAA